MQYYKAELFSRFTYSSDSKVDSVGEHYYIPRATVLKNFCANEPLNPPFSRMALSPLPVIGRSDIFPMAKMVQNAGPFQTHRYARYATDMTVQHTSRPAGNLEETKAYYSGKHKMYVYKVEVCVLPNRKAISCRDHFPGAI